MLGTVIDWMRRQPTLRRTAKSAVWLIPDCPWTRRFPEIGPIKFRLRRHRWLIWEQFAQSDGQILGTFNRLIHPGDVAYDIGANIGLYTRAMHTWFGASHVVAFEPMHENFTLLEDNIRLGSMESCSRLFTIALSDEDGTEELQIDDINSGSAVLNSVSKGAASEGRQIFGLPPLTETITVRTLDGFIEAEDLLPPQMMKIDTEGAEYKVLAGGRETLKKHKPHLAIAFHGPDKAEACLKLLNELGYHCYGFAYDEDGRRAYRRLSDSDATRLADNNIVASFNESDVRDEIVPQMGGRSSANV